MNTNEPASVVHPAILRALARHREFWAGTRSHLVKIHVPVTVDGLETSIPFDTMNWDRDFDEYVRVGVANGVKQARARLDLGLDG